MKQCGEVVECDEFLRECVFRESVGEGVEKRDDEECEESRQRRQEEQDVGAFFHMFLLKISVVGVGHNLVCSLLECDLVGVETGKHIGICNNIFLVALHHIA